MWPYYKHRPGKRQPGGTRTGGGHVPSSRQEARMATRSYDEVLAEAMEHYQAQDYAGALEILTREGDQFPEEAANVLYLRSCMAARVGQPDLALQILEDALDRGL